MKSGNINFLEPSGPLHACNGTDLPLRRLQETDVSLKNYPLSFHNFYENWKRFVQDNISATAEC
jgi:hypothetical protein